MKIPTDSRIPSQSEELKEIKRTILSVLDRMGLPSREDINESIKNYNMARVYRSHGNGD